MKYILLTATVFLAGCATQNKQLPLSVTATRQHVPLNYMQRLDPEFNSSMRDAGGGGNQ